MNEVFIVCATYHSLLIVLFISRHVPLKFYKLYIENLGYKLQVVSEIINSLVPFGLQGLGRWKPERWSNGENKLCRRRA